MDNPYKNTLVWLRGGKAIFPFQDLAIEQTLARLLESGPAQFILLVDNSGLLINIIGAEKNINPVSLASLIAADLAASQEIAHQTQQYSNFQLVLREGQRSNSFIVEAGKYLILFVQLSKDVPLGWARMKILETAQQIEEIMNATPETSAEIDKGMDWTNEELSSQIDESLDQLWS